MKSRLFALTVAAGIIAGAFPVFAADQQPPAQQQQPPQRQRGQGMGQRMFADLNLTAEQQTQVQELMRKMREASGTPEENRKAFNDGLARILTPEQKEKYDKARLERQNQDPVAAPNADDYLKQLTEKLSLTEDQVAKVKDLLKTAREKAAEDARGARTAYRENLVKLLTDEQKKKFEEAYPQPLQQRFQRRQQN
jgi:Spy/CpxP family protein refolding chaperone